MKNRLMIFTFIVALLMSFNVNAAEKMKTSGFLSDYSGMKKGPEGGADWVYIKEGVNFANYNKVMVDQVTF